MTVRLPSVLDSSHYLRPIRSETGGTIANTHLAMVKDAAGVPARAFVKVFPDTSPRGLLNEWLGYALMSALGIPQPPAAIMQTPFPNGVLYWAFVSFQPRPVSEGTPKEIYDLHDGKKVKRMVARLLACHAFASMVAADQLCMNADRNLGNLVFTGHKEFVVIDHGEILGGSDWATDSLLCTTRWVDSKALQIATLHGPLPVSVANSIYAAAEVVAEQFFESYSALVSNVNPNDERDIAIAINAIWWRSLELTKWFSDNLGLVL